MELGNAKFRVHILIWKFHMNSYLWAKNYKYGDDAKFRGHNLTILCKQDLYLINSTIKDDDDDDDDNNNNNNNNNHRMYNFGQ